MVIGDGAREHAIAWAVARSGARIHALVRHVNPGLAELARETSGRVILGNYLDPAEAVRAAEQVSPDLIIVGPEEPLFRGVSDALRERGFPVFGASRRLAEIERRKDFARGLMWRHRIPGRLAYAVFSDTAEAARYARAAGAVAIKPIRQAGGRGVRVVQSDPAYLSDAVSEIVEAGTSDVAESLRAYSDVELGVLVEEAVWGVEYTVQVVTDGEAFVAMPPVQDNPHAYELGLGPECGGMGTIAPVPFITEGEYAESVEIVRRSVEALQRELGERYIGVLSGQMMLTAYGPTLIEYYARLGDPEALNALYLMESDALEMFQRAAEGRLAGYSPRFRQEATVVKAVAPVGYPLDRKMASGQEIAVDWDVVRREGCLVFFGSVEEAGAGTYRTLGSRAVEVLGSGRSFDEAYERAERCAAAVKAVRGEVFYRSDIGSPWYMAYMSRRAAMVRRVYEWRRARGLGRVRIDWVPGGEVRVYDYG